MQGADQGQAGALDGAGLRIGIVQARFNAPLTDRLAAGCLAELEALGVAAADMRHIQVPGALEVPVALAALAAGRRFDALVALGCVVRGETYHFELVANESGRGVMEVQLETGIPIANGIITTETEAQAEARIGKGAEAARVAVEMARLRSGIAGLAK